MLAQQASVLADLGEYARAHQLLNEADAISQKSGFANGNDYTSARLKVAFALRNPDEALAIIEKGYGPLVDQGPLSFSLLRNLLSRAEVALLKNDPALAARLAVRASNAIVASPIRPYVRFWEARAALEEGTAYLAQSQIPNALPRLQRALELDLEMYDPLSTEMLPAQAALANAYLQSGDRDRAKPLLAQAESIRKLHGHLGERYEAPLRALAKLEGAGVIGR